MPIPVRRCDAACGAEIVFDLSQPIDDATFAELERHFHDNIVVFFRDQHLSEEQQIAFSRRFGELEIHIVKKYLLPGHPEILLISNIRNEDGEHIGLADAGFTWHSDTSYRRIPEPLLAALREGGAASRRQAARRHGVRQYDRRLRGAARGDEAPPRTDSRRSTAIRCAAASRTRPRPKLTAAQLAETPDIAHPIVRTHPHTGRKALYVTAGECIGIEGMPEDEALDLIAELDAHCVKPEFCYRHRWRVGDLVMWDNASAMHLAICDYALPERRLMHRTTVIGTQPF